MRFLSLLRRKNTTPQVIPTSARASTIRGAEPTQLTHEQCRHIGVRLDEKFEHLTAGLTFTVGIPEYEEETRIIAQAGARELEEAGKVATDLVLAAAAKGFHDRHLQGPGLSIFPHLFNGIYVIDPAPDLDKAKASFITDFMAANATSDGESTVRLLADALIQATNEAVDETLGKVRRR